MQFFLFLLPHLSLYSQRLSLTEHLVNGISEFLYAHYDDVKLSVIKIFFFIIIVIIIANNMCMESDEEGKQWKNEKEKKQSKKIKSLCRSLNSFIIAHFFRLSSFYALEKISFQKKKILFFIFCVFDVSWNFLFKTYEE